jgi:HD superfamily phosphohydrolase
MWIDANDGYQLKVRSGGVVTLEQILFSKIHAFSRIYHHHKVRSAECFIKGIIEMIRENKFTIAGKGLLRAIDYLELSDRDFLYLNDKPEQLQGFVKRYTERGLFKRALVISHDTVEDTPASPGYNELTALADDIGDRVKILRSEVWERSGRPCSVHEIWLDLPRAPHSIDSAQAIVKDPGGADRILKDIFPSDRWLTTYESGKWKGHVFCPPDEQIRSRVSKAAIEVLSETFDIRFNRKATEQAKLVA